MVLRNQFMENISNGIKLKDAIEKSLENLTEFDE